MHFTIMLSQKKKNMQVSTAHNYDAKLRSVISLLKNAPNLTFLEPKRLYIASYDLDEIHD
jgi:hypothetical protein